MECTHHTAHPSICPPAAAGCLRLWVVEGSAPGNVGFTWGAQILCLVAARVTKLAGGRGRGVSHEPCVAGRPAEVLPPGSHGCGQVRSTVTAPPAFLWKRLVSVLGSRAAGLSGIAVSTAEREPLPQLYKPPLGDKGPHHDPGSLGDGDAAVGQPVQ